MIINSRRLFCRGKLEVMLKNNPQTDWPLQRNMTKEYSYACPGYKQD